MSRRPRLLRHRLAAGLLAAATFAAVPGIAAAQTREIQRVPDSRDAQDTREAFRDVLRSYPPSLSRILRLDPTLMTNDAYLAPYPSVAQFLKAHPEILRNPSFYIPTVVDSYDGAGWRETTPEQEARRQAMNLWESVLGGIAALVVFIVVTLTLVWLIRFVVAHRRWLRTSRVQQEVHGRLLERLSSNEELLAYLKSDAGRDFLHAQPALPEVAEPASVAAPYGRILLSVQAGVVLICGGLGLLFVRRDVIDEINQMLFTLGVLGVAIGAGFFIAAVLTYVISNRMGLLQQKRPPLAVRSDAPSA